MILAVDIGNSSTVAGIVDSSNSSVLAHKRFSTEPARSTGEYLELFGDLTATLDSGGGMDADGAIVCSVVPAAVSGAAASLKEITGRPVSIVSIDGSVLSEPETVSVTPGMEVDVDNSHEVGADRVVNAVAAFELFGGPVVVVDFGTALTLDYVSAGGVYCGGVIGPGIGISLEALNAKTAKLPLVSFSRPASVVGRNTVEAIRSGAYWGTVSMVDGIVEKIVRERGALNRVVATGGFAGTVASDADSVDEVDEFLTLKGLGLIYERNR